MKLTSKIALIAAFGFAAPAMAASACLSVKHTTGIRTQTVTIKNLCDHAVGWYVDKEGPNSPCFHIGPGRNGSYKWTKRDHYHGTFICV